jgi:phage protein D
MSEQALYQIVVDGLDASERFHPILIDLRVHLAAESVSDTAEIELDDTNGRIALPRAGAFVAIALGWRDSGISPVFEGTVDDIKSRGARGAGRTLNITAKSADTRGKGKHGQERHWDKKKLSEVMQDAGKEAGFSVQVDDALGSIEREWWGMSAESFYHFGHRIAREVGGVFKIYGKRALLVKRNAGLSASGLGLSSVLARAGGNLINWDISPTVARPRYQSVIARWYDMRAAKWKQEKVEIGGIGGTADNITRFTEADKDEAKHSGNNAKEASDRNKGEGSVVIEGDPGATPEGLCIVVGARPGIDGAYRIDTVDHELSRDNGFTTTLSLKQPQGSAGTDTR